MPYFKQFLLLSTIILATSSPVSATPVIGIGSMYDVLMPDTQSMTKRIYNTGDSTAFIRVALLEINPDSTSSNKEKPQKALSGNTLDHNRLIVTPQRLIIPPASFQAVRILWPGSREKERYFRIRFTPVMPEANDGFNLDETAASEYRKATLHAGLNVLTGYGTIAIVQPDNPVFNTLTDSAADKITVKNNGNATVSLDNLRQCKLSKRDCEASTREFILPGRTITRQKKAGYTLHFTLIEGKSKRELSY